MYNKFADKEFNRILRERTVLDPTKIVKTKAELLEEAYSEFYN